jgi:hypothetical protein
VLRTRDIPHKYQKHQTKFEVIQDVLKILGEAWISLTSFVTAILDEPTFANHQSAFYSELNKNRFEDFLESLWNHKKGTLRMKDWFKPHAISLMCDLVYKEMDAAKPHLYMTTNQVTPEFITNWDNNSLMEKIGKDITPTWTCILDAAMETKVAKLKQTKSGSRNC